MSERDYARKVILLGKTSRETCVDEIMSKNVITIHPDQTIEEALELMNHKHIRHLPVQENEHVIGIIRLATWSKRPSTNSAKKLKEPREKYPRSHWQH